jgi:hypothetical protein
VAGRVPQSPVLTGNDSSAGLEEQRIDSPRILREARASPPSRAESQLPGTAGILMACRWSSRQLDHRQHYRGRDGHRGCAVPGPYGWRAGSTPASSRSSTSCGRRTAAFASSSQGPDRGSSPAGRVRGPGHARHDPALVVMCRKSAGEKREASPSVVIGRRTPS